MPGKRNRYKKKETDSDFSDNSEIQEMKAKERGEKKKRIRKVPLDAAGNPINRARKVLLDADGNPIKRVRNIKLDPDGNPIRCMRKPNLDADGNLVKTRKHKPQKTYDSEGNVVLKFACEICPYKTWLKNDLKKHMQRHNPEHQCPFCEKKESAQFMLKVHIQRVHTGERPFECKLCNFTSVTSSELNSHHKRHHLGIARVRKNACKYCTYKAESIGSLKSHIQSVHNINRTERFKCHLCPMKTTCKSRYEKHMVAHESGVEFICNFCGKKFVDLQESRNHEKNHRKILKGLDSSFKCQFCDKTFPFPAYLRNHEKIHSENKYWNCRLCGTKFSSRSAFQRHFLRRHKNEKMYGCDDCGFYTDSYILQNKHMTSETHLSVKTQTIQSIPSTNYNWPKTKPSFNHFRDGALDIDINRLPNVSNLKVTPTYLV